MVDGEGRPRLGDDLPSGPRHVVDGGQAVRGGIGDPQLPAAERDALGVGAAARAGLDAEVILAELEDDAIREDGRPDRAAADG